MSMINLSSLLQEMDNYTTEIKVLGGIFNQTSDIRFEIALSAEEGGVLRFWAYWRMFLHFFRTKCDHFQLKINLHECKYS